MTDPKPRSPLLDTPGALTRMGCALMGSGQGDRAVRLIAGLEAAHPDHAMLAVARHAILSHRVPSWHAGMLFDRTRNNAFGAAIARAVPGRRVLDIGTGSGLLAMMAARAGAASVVACEANAALAETARNIVAANGLTDRITVIGKRSGELDRVRDLDGGADVIVAEIFGDDLLDEGVLQSLNHARAELAAPGARFLPARASLMIALADHPARRDPFDAIAGFDLSLFGRHLTAENKVRIDDRKLALASAPTALLTFDFAVENPATGAADVTLTATRQASGTTRWIRLMLDDERLYENAPGTGRGSHWATIFQPFGDGRVVQAGETVTIRASHDGERVLVWPD